jgi:histone H3/H4
LPAIASRSPTSAGRVLGLSVRSGDTRSKCKLADVAEVRTTGLSIPKASFARMLKGIVQDPSNDFGLGSHFFKHFRWSKRAVKELHEAAEYILTQFVSLGQ